MSEHTKLKYLIEEKSTLSFICFSLPTTIFIQMSVYDQSLSDAAAARIHFMKTLDIVCDKSPKASLLLYDGSQQTGTLEAVDKNFEQMGLKDFTTPLGTLKAALVRTSDVACLTIPAKHIAGTDL